MNKSEKKKDVIPYGKIRNSGNTDRMKMDAFRKLCEKVDRLSDIISKK